MPSELPATIYVCQQPSFQHEENGQCNGLLRFHQRYGRTERAWVCTRCFLVSYSLPPSQKTLDNYISSYQEG